MGKNFLIILTACLFMTGCFKDSVHNGADTAPAVGIYQGGIDSMTYASLNLTTPDSLYYYIYTGVTSPYTFYKNVTITVAVDDAARVAYNQSHSMQYEALPDSLYKLMADSVVLPAGSRSVTLPVLIYTGKADLRKNYMLPIAIKDAQGVKINDKNGIIYLNQAGSPVSGRYKVTGTRTNYIGKASDGNVETIVDLSVLPVKTTTTTSYENLSIDYSDLGIAGWKYLIYYDPADKVVTIVPNSVMANDATGYKAGSFVVEVQDFDAVNRILHFKTRYTNEAGNERVVDEYLTAQ